MREQAQAASVLGWALFQRFGLFLMRRPGLAPAGDLLFLLVQAKKAKEHDPSVCVPALRSGQTCVTQFRLRCGKTHCAARRFVQTRCRKFDDDALALFGANARSLNRVPQAQPDGRERAACMSCDEICLGPIALKSPGIAPCAHACDGGLLWRAVAPQSATASSSLLRQRV